MIFFYSNIHLPVFLHFSFSNLESFFFCEVHTVKPDIITIKKANKCILSIKLKDNWKSTLKSLHKSVYFKQNNVIFVFRKYCNISTVCGHKCQDHNKKIFVFFQNSRWNKYWLRECKNLVYHRKPTLVFLMLNKNNMHTVNGKWITKWNAIWINASLKCQWYNNDNGWSPRSSNKTNVISPPINIMKAEDSYHGNIHHGNASARVRPALHNIGRFLLFVHISIIFRYVFNPKNSNEDDLVKPLHANMTDSKSCLMKQD